MATYSHLFGHFEWPEPDARPAPTGYPAAEREPAPVEAITVAIPVGLRRRLEATAELQGLPWETWAVRTLARSIDPRLASR